MLRPAGLSDMDAKTVTAMFNRAIGMRAAKMKAIEQMKKGGKREGKNKKAHVPTDRA
jgi:hypothetical protein